MFQCASVDQSNYDIQLSNSSLSFSLNHFSCDNPRSNLINKCDKSQTGLNPHAKIFTQTKFDEPTYCLSDISKDSMFSDYIMPDGLSSNEISNTSPLSDVLSSPVILSRNLYFNIYFSHAFIALLILSVFITFLLLYHLKFFESIESEWPKEKLKRIKNRYPTKLVLGHLNINSLRNKFESLTQIIDKSIDILLLSESKLGQSFPNGQFVMNGFQQPFRLDRNEKGGGLIVYIKEDIPCRQISLHYDLKIELIIIEINLKKRKWVLLCIYNPHKEMIRNFLSSLCSILDELTVKYENIIILGDFNCEMKEESMNTFCNTYNLKCLVKEKTCFKNIHNPSCIDLILTNKPRYFQNTCVIETGLSDFHKLTLTIMKSEFIKQLPKIMHYRNYKYFDNTKFQNDLMFAISKIGLNIITCEQFEKVFMDTLNKHAPSKIRYVRANNSPFLNKNIYKAIMVRSRLRNKYLKLKTYESREEYKKQRNLCVGLIRDAKKQFYENLNPKSIRDTKRFWSVVKPCFSDKTHDRNSITLLEKNEIINEPAKCAQIFNDYFIDAVEKLEIDRTLHINVNQGIKNKVDQCIDMFKNHPSILMINTKGFSKENFSFKHVSAGTVLEIINSIDSSKAYQKDNIPPTILQQNSELSALVLTRDINRCIDEGKFPSNLKNSDVTPVYKKDDRLQKQNYRPISILPTLSKIYERILHQQLYDYFNVIFSKYLCGYRKGYSTQHTLLYMLEKLKEALDKKNHTGILMTDLSKAFDCLSHELIIAKLYAYGLSKNSLELISDYFLDRKQRTKIRESYSNWRNILFGVFQGSIFGPLGFNIYINDLFLFSDPVNISNYADDNSPYEVALTNNEVLNKLEENACLLIEWFNNNYMKPNPEKWHLLLSDIDNNHSIKVGQQLIHNSNTEKILGVTFDNKLSFKCHINKICKKASQKLYALARVSNYMTFNQRRIIMNTFISSHFNYCPIVWMCHNRTLNNQINRIHHRALSIVYRDYTASFKTLLEKSNSVTIHLRNIQLLAIEIFKAQNDLSPSLMSEIFRPKETKYNLRRVKGIMPNAPRTSTYGINSISHLAPKIWNLIPTKIKDSKNLNTFKRLIKSWVPNPCPCNLCRDYIQNVGFI